MNAVIIFVFQGLKDDLDLSGIKMKEFIEAKTTIENIDRDFIEWHQGKKYYGLWAVEIEKSSWLKNVEKARKHLSGFLFSDYKRVPHITICTSGFLENTKDYKNKLEKQIRLIEKREFEPFEITLGALDSFTTCPYFKVEDSTNCFSEIRKMLLKTISEERSKKYIPHMTVGLYDDIYSTTSLAERLNLFETIQASPIQVTKLDYFIYRTNSIFSPLEEQFYIDLGDNKK